MKLSKILIKVLNEANGQVEWVHFCYLPNELYSAFHAKLKDEDLTTADYIEKWAKEDFNVDLNMNTTRDIAILKALIKERCKIAYPGIYIDSSTDRQGWVRTWLQKYMEKEIFKYAKPNWTRRNENTTQNSSR